jgi:hypothetical protein
MHGRQGEQSDTIAALPQGGQNAALAALGKDGKKKARLLGGLSFYLPRLVSVVLFIGSLEFSS